MYKPVEETFSEALSVGLGAASAALALGAVSQRARGASVLREGLYGPDLCGLRRPRFTDS